MHAFLVAVALPVAIAVSIGPALTAEANFNAYMMRSYAKLMNPAEGRTNLGYDIGSYYTRDLQYGQERAAIKSHTRVPAKATEKAPPKGATMCNAAVVETIIEAINLYAKDNPRWSPQKAIPTDNWNRVGFPGLRAHLFSESLFEYRPFDKYKKKEIEKLDAKLAKDIKKFHSADAMASAFEKFKIGRHVPFEEAKPGDIISFDRENDRSDGLESRGGHVVVFLGFLDRNQNLVKPFDQKVVGFKFFSSQGDETSGGLGERWAYFKGFCPVVRGYKLPVKEAGKPLRAGCKDRIYNAQSPEQKTPGPTDCCLVKSGENGPRVGRLSSPVSWGYKSVQTDMEEKYQDLKDRLKVFARNREKDLFNTRVLATGAVALEAQNSKKATAFIDKLNRSQNGDLRAIARDGSSAATISPILAKQIADTAPRTVVNAANRRVTTDVKNAVQADMRNAESSAVSELQKSEATGVPNSKLDQTE
jgi:hypothetical protein